VRKAAAALLCLLCRTMPLASSEVIFERTYQVPRPLGGSESVTVRLTTDNDPVVVRVDTGDPTSIHVFTRSTTMLTVSKHEESGGYAHGIDWWVDDENQDRLLYSFANNGSADLGTFPSGTEIRIQLYRIDVFFYEAIDPLYRIVTIRDATAPSFVISPEPGAYPRVVVTAAPTDAGVGMDDPEQVTLFSITSAITGDTISTGRGTQVTLDEEGAWNVTFSARDLLDNVGSCPASSGPPNSYLVDRSPPVLSGVTPSLLARLDGALDFTLAFCLRDTVAGVSLPALHVAVRCEADGVEQWTREFGESDLLIEPSGDVLAVQVPMLTVPRSSILRVELSAADAIGNALGPGARTMKLAMPPVAFRASVLVSEVAAEAVASGHLLVARYQVPLALDRSRDALRAGGVSRYRLTRTIEETGETETVIDLDPAGFAACFEDREGTAVFTDSMEGGRYAHRKISYAIETVFAVAGSEVQAAEGIAIMPNIEAWQVLVLAGGKLLQEYRSGGLPYPELRVRSIAGMWAEIGPDPEGDGLAMQLEIEGPGGIVVAWPSTGWTLRAVLSDALPEAPDGVYRVRFIVSEAGSDQPMTSDWYAIVVDRNYGEIDGDVVWTTDQVMTGSIVVKAGARLTIADGVIVSVAHGTDPATGAGFSIGVAPGGTLVVSPGGTVQPVGWLSETTAGEGWEYWAGIVVVGTATIDGGTIRGATRGVAALPGSSVVLQGARVEACRTGVHTYGTGVEPAIDRTSFVGCSRYGIKEDEGAAPVVTDCRFARNTCDYYDSALTAVVAEDIDLLEPGFNHGNRSVGGAP
jgi:hypothetical protein